MEKGKISAQGPLQEIKSSLGEFTKHLKTDETQGTGEGLELNKEPSFREELPESALDGKLHEEEEE